MSELDIQFTNRMNSILKRAEQEATDSKDEVITPIHLFLACLQEKGGALGELSLKIVMDRKKFRDQINIHIISHSIKSNYFNMPINEEVVRVFDVSIEYMKRYNQVYLNEGHLLKALIVTNVLDDILSDESKQIILSIGTTGRDMATHLGSYVFPEVNSDGIRKANKRDEEVLVNFVERNFSTEWAQTVKSGFLTSAPSLYIAENEEEQIIGFAAYDVYLGKKGYFGPMGVITSNRNQGTGYALLHHCLRDMKEIGYEYAIIGGAGPLEFYEKACHAVVIPQP
ncbi:GNAT family N-acetyltransferase [Ornithinibacillus californiensis]|uniref:GNAT family N-acetyltransferase n=1 Tax=Ornithinibacillus californiensis TaxID=161536 RepID=UPI001F001656|nr:GNAT family N-acetyltransferase [Ornithinibacillus californiensis]